MLKQEVNIENPLKLNSAGVPENELAPAINHLCNALIVQAMNGNVHAFELIANRLEGLPKQTVKQKGKLKVDSRITMEQLKKSIEKKRARDQRERDKVSRGQNQ